MDKGSCLKRRYIAVNERNLRVGESHGRSTISDEVVARVRFLHGIKGKSYGYIAMRTGLSKQTISKICRWKTRGQVPSRWVPVDRKGKRIVKREDDLAVYAEDGVLHKCLLPRRKLNFNGEG